MQLRDAPAINIKDAVEYWTIFCSHKKVALLAFDGKIYSKENIKKKKKTGKFCVCEDFVCVYRL